MDTSNDLNNELEAVRMEITGLTGLSLVEAAGGWTELYHELTIWLNDLIQHDMQGLIRILYRVDINESKLKFLLQEKVGEDAATIIAHLIIDRQLQKIKTRQQFRQPPPENEEDRW